MWNLPTVVQRERHRPVHLLSAGGAAPYQPARLARDHPGADVLPGGAHVAEVEIDPDTGVIDIVNYVAVDDCGRVINHVLLEGQTFGASCRASAGADGALRVRRDRPAPDRLVHGLRHAAAEILTGAKLYEHCVPSPTISLEPRARRGGHHRLDPTLANAVIDALRPLGIHHLDFPYSPARIWQAIRAAAG